MVVKFTKKGSQNSEATEMSSPSEQLHRPTIITIAPSCENTTPPHSQTPDTPTNGQGVSPIEVTSPQMPRPLVEPIDSDRPERMRDWLIRMINSGRFPGLRWLNQDQAVFRVPWIHAKKRDYNQERDAALFREWALHSGKYGDGSDVTTWKINFRCALNGLKDIVERKDLEEQDCRVYQMLPQLGSNRRRKRRRPDYFSSEFGGLQSPEEVEPRMRLELQSPGTTLSIIHPTSLTPVSTLTPTAGSPIQVLPIIPAGHAPMRVPFINNTLSQPLGVIQKLRPVGHNGIYTAVVPSNGEDHHVKDEDIPTPRTPRTPVSPVMHFSPKLVSPLHTHSATTAAFPMGPPLPLSPTLRQGPVYCPPPEFCTNSSAVVVRILYGSITVHMETFDCSQGARIYYGPLHQRDILSPEKEAELFGPLDAHQISLSPRHPAGLAREIFNNTKRGLVFEVEDECIYATALCKTMVYYGNSVLKYRGSLVKEQRTRVFNFQKRFLPSLKHNSEGRGFPPQPYALFSLGQPWGADRPLSKNLVTVTVTYCKALNELRLKNVPIHDELLFEPQEAKDIRIISPTPTDLEVEHFLNPNT